MGRDRQPEPRSAARTGGDRRYGRVFRRGAETRPGAVGDQPGDRDAGIDTGRHSVRPQRPPAAADRCGARPCRPGPAGAGQRRPLRSGGGRDATGAGTRTGARDRPAGSDRAADRQPERAQRDLSRPAGQFLDRGSGRLPAAAAQRLGGARHLPAAAGRPRRHRRLPVAAHRHAAGGRPRAIRWRRWGARPRAATWSPTSSSCSPIL